MVRILSARKRSIREYEGKKMTVFFFTTLHRLTTISSILGMISSS